MGSSRSSIGFCFEAAGLGSWLLFVSRVFRGSWLLWGSARLVGFEFGGLACLSRSEGLAGFVYYPVFEIPSGGPSGVAWEFLLKSSVDFVSFIVCRWI